MWLLIMIKVKAKKGNLLKIKNATEEEENIIRELGHFFNGKDKSLIKIVNGNKLKIKDLKHFILESENRLLDLSTNQILIIQATKRLDILSSFLISTHVQYLINHILYHL